MNNQLLENNLLSFIHYNLGTILRKG